MRLRVKLLLSCNVWLGVRIIRTVFCGLVCLRLSVEPLCGAEDEAKLEPFCLAEDEAKLEPFCMTALRM